MCVHVQPHVNSCFFKCPFVIQDFDDSETTSDDQNGKRPTSAASQVSRTDSKAPTNPEQGMQILTNHD